MAAARGTRRISVPTVAALAGVALVVVLGGIVLANRLFSGSSGQAVVPAASSTSRNCEVLVQAYAKEGGPTQRCVAVDDNTALAEVRAGQVDFAITTEDLSGADTQSLRSTRVFRDLLVLVTSREHPLAENLSLPDIAALYSTGTIDPSRLDPACPRAAVFSLRRDAGSTLFLAEKARIKGFANGIQEVGTDDAMARAVGNQDCSIGFLSPDALSGDVKPVALAGINPTPSNPNFKQQLVAYPLARWAFMIQRISDSNKSSSKDGSSFLKFILSPKGQQSLVDNGSVPRYQ